MVVYTVSVENHAGNAGKHALDIIMAATQENLIAWETSDGGGDCLFSATDVMYNLCRSDADESDWYIVSGIFKQDGKKFFHAWLEYKGGIIVNVSNMFSHKRPMYARNKKEYLTHNNCVQTLVRLSGDKFKKRYKDYLKDDPDGELRRALAKKVFRKVLYIFR